MAKLSEKEFAAWEKTRDLNAELMQTLQEMKRGDWARKTEFSTQVNGSIRRVVTRRDGTIENDEIVPAERAQVLAARAATGLSQAAFAKLLGVWVRTLQGVGARAEIAFRSSGNFA